MRKTAILQQRLLSEKRSTFASYNITLSESFCLTDHEKQIQKFVAKSALSASAPSRLSCLRPACFQIFFKEANLRLS